MDKNFNVKVNESFNFDLKDSDVDHLDLLKLSTSKMHVVNAHKSLNIQLEKSDFLNKNYTIKVNNNSYTVSISDPLDLLIKEMGFSSGTSKKSNNIKAPMPGIILSINVNEGQEVKEGDTLLILEAMKMENAIGAPKDGIVKSINAESGKTVEKGELIIEFA